MSDQHPPDGVSKSTPDPQEPHPIPIEAARQQARALDSAIARIDSSFRDIMRSLYQHERALTGAHERAFETLRAESEEIRALLEPAREKLSGLFRMLGVTARVISGVASHIQVEETEALHVSRIALMVRGYLRSECVKELLSQAQDSSLTHSTLQLRATMSAIRHPCLIMGQCPSNFEGRNSWE